MKRANVRLPDALRRALWRLRAYRRRKTLKRLADVIRPAR